LISADARAADETDSPGSRERKPSPDMLVRGSDIPADIEGQRPRHNRPEPTRRRCLPAGAGPLPAAHHPLAPPGSPMMTVAMQRPSHLLTAGPASAAGGQLLRAALLFDAETTTAIARASIADHGVIATWDRLIRPVWDGLGRGGGYSDTLFAAERLFSGSMSRAMAMGAMAMGRRPPGRSGRVLLACAEGEHQTLPLDTLTAALAEQGIDGRVLGACVPSWALASAVKRLHPVVVVVWSQVRDVAGSLSPLPVSDRGVEVIHAGPGWDRTRFAAPDAPMTTVAGALTLTTALLDHHAGLTGPPRDRPEVLVRQPPFAITAGVRG
jgi:MerR family transcriptional regulator, light-induced transcriptional regulator